MGENVPELTNVPRGAQIIPNDVLRDGGIGGGAVTVRGGDVVIQGDASDKTVALIRQALARQNAELPSRVVAAVEDAKARRGLA
ncbi:ribosomal protein L16/L10AE [Bradyrhizobium sp. USDA 4518]